ncbi:hypothetical protein [Azospirillum picis]|uniref:Uncharacterized protein n=1 Tax=Azospirillum picis TaxID=488438 RepID=A0ABU0MQ07_9PROT|nr:hypothetical protein [Azospirillum picis]MBP2301624.1 hypothetical protein [Azospirillum picis]MDQ0535553.1 hypothetical protein [Azospirillum picis]
MDAGTCLDILYRDHDGPPPAPALRAALLGGTGRANAQRQAAALDLHGTLAAQARLAAARRRNSLTAAACRTDAWLARLAATLAHHRSAAVACRDQRNAYSQ